MRLSLRYKIEAVKMVSMVLKGPKGLPKPASMLKK